MKNKNFVRKKQAIYISPNKKSTRIIKTLIDFFFFIKVKIKMVCFSVPSLTEGGRRLYSEEDLKRMKIICFLRDAGISINSIGELLSEHDPGSVISVLLEQQENILKEEIHERQVKLDMLDGIKQELKTIENFSIESIGDWC